MVTYTAARFQRDVILICGRWYAAYSLSHRQLITGVIKRKWISRLDKPSHYAVIADCIDCMDTADCDTLGRCNSQKSHGREGSGGSEADP